MKGHKDVHALLRIVGRQPSQLFHIGDECRERVVRGVIDGLWPKKFPKKPADLQACIEVIRYFFFDGANHHDGLAAMKSEMRLSYSSLCRVLISTWPTLDVVKAVPGLEWRKQVLSLLPMEELVSVMSADNLLKTAILENDLGL